MCLLYERERMANYCDVDCDGGYQFDLVIDSLTEAIQCSICALLLRDAVELPCTHSFCKICWKRWQNSKEEQLEPTTCPLCNKIYRGNLERESGAMNRFITTVLDVYCLQSNEGCKWIGKIHEYQEHEDDHCEYVNVECRYQGCDFEGKRKDIKKHEQECQYHIAQCEWCEDMHLLIQMEDHYKSCKSYPVQCPNEGCEEVLKRSDKAGMENHMKTTCEYQEIDCQFHSIGCSEKVLRRLLDDHLEDCVHEHASLMMKKLMSLIHEAKRKDKLLMAIKNELAVSRKRESELEEKLKIVEKKLSQGNIGSDDEQFFVVENESKVFNITEKELEERLELIEDKIHEEKSECANVVNSKSVFSESTSLSDVEDFKDHASGFSSILKSMDIDTYYHRNEDNELFIKIPMRNSWVCNEFHIYFSDDLPTISYDRYCKYSSKTVAIKSGNLWMEVHLKNQELVNKETSLDCYVMCPSLNIKKCLSKITEGHYFFNSFCSAFFLDMENKEGYLEELNHIILYIKIH